MRSGMYNAMKDDDRALPASRREAQRAFLITKASRPIPNLASALDALIDFYDFVLGKS